MFDEVDAYCSLYVDANIEESVLAREIGEFFGVESEGDYVTTPQGNIAVVKNDEFDAKQRKDEKNGFLFYRMLLEIEPKVEMGKINAVTLVSRLLNHLWERNFPAVAACHYEDELPNKGKLISENHSWGKYYIWK